MVVDRSDGLDKALTPRASRGSRNGHPHEAALDAPRLRPARLDGNSAAPPPSRVPPEPGSWWRFLRANLFWIVGVTLLVTAAAGAAVELMTPMYTATAEVVVYPPASSADSSLASLVMGTEEGVAKSRIGALDGRTGPGYFREHFGERTFGYGSCRWGPAQDLHHGRQPPAGGGVHPGCCLCLC